MQNRIKYQMHPLEKKAIQILEDKKTNDGAKCEKLSPILDEINFKITGAGGRLEFFPSIETHESKDEFKRILQGLFVIAAKAGHEKCMQMLRNIQPNSSTLDTFENVFAYALSGTIQDDREICFNILAKESSQLQKNLALSFATHQGCKKYVKLLLNLNADPTFSPYSGEVTYPDGSKEILHDRRRSITL